MELDLSRPDAAIDLFDRAGSRFGKRRWRSSGGGRIINVTSGQNQGPMPAEMAYAVTKAGLDALTLSLAAELITSGVTVNAFDPGPIDTGWMTADQRRSSTLRRRRNRAHGADYSHPIRRRGRESQERARKPA